MPQMPKDSIKITKTTWVLSAHHFGVEKVNAPKIFLRNPESYMVFIGFPSTPYKKLLDTCFSMAILIIEGCGG
jgi:hypothetical protein